MLHRTTSGCCERDIGMSKANVPHYCTHGSLYVYVHGLKQSSTPKQQAGKGRGLRRTQRREGAAEKKARERFNEVVGEWPCFFAGKPCRGCDGNGEIDLFILGGYAGHAVCPECEGSGEHHCKGRKDRHHLVQKQWIRRTFSDLPKPELEAILFDPRVGAPLCRDRAHNPVTNGFAHIYFDELNPECIEFCEWVDERYGDLGDGRRRPSMLTRLKRECPERQPVESLEAVR